MAIDSKSSIEVENSNPIELVNSTNYPSDLNRRKRIYHGIIELIARFGYISSSEVEYRFAIERKQALYCLSRMEKTHGLLERFESGTSPMYFYCFSRKGKRLVQDSAIGHAPSRFSVSDYRVVGQNHHRMIVKAYITLRDVLGADLIDWVSEAELKSEHNGAGKRVLDGEFHVTVYKQSMATDQETQTLYPAGPVSIEPWKCGLEVELSLKSSARYCQQFATLAAQTYEPFEENQKLPMLLFVCGSRAIYDRLRAYIGNHDFGNCVFYFVEMDEFFCKKRDAAVEKVIRAGSKMIKLEEFNRVRVYA